jgi:hypothetical protein
MIDTLQPGPLTGTGEGLVTVLLGGIALGVLLMVVLMRPQGHAKTDQRQKRLIFWCPYCRRWHGTHVWYEPRD